MLKINATGGLPTIPINRKRTPHIGDVVLAIGNPYNPPDHHSGIISATGRIGLNPSGRQNFLQTDASINHGNSGGALVNSLGELMGINTLSFDKSNDGETPEGIGFAIPFQLATKIMDKLIRDGRVIRGYIGIGGREIAPMHTQGGGIDQIQDCGQRSGAWQLGGQRRYPGERRYPFRLRYASGLCAGNHGPGWLRFARAPSSLLKSCVMTRS